MLDTGADGGDGQPADGGHGDRVMAFVDPRETDPFDPAQRRFLGGAFGGGQAVGAQAGRYPVEGGVVVDVPAGGDHVLGRAPPEQEAAFPPIEAEARQVRAEGVVVHADGVGAEAPPVGEAVEEVRALALHPVPVLATTYRSQAGMRSASMRPPAGRLTLSSAPHSTRVGTGRRGPGGPCGRPGRGCPAPGAARRRRRTSCRPDGRGRGRAGRVRRGCGRRDSRTGRRRPPPSRNTRSTAGR